MGVLPSKFENLYMETSISARCHKVIMDAAGGLAFAWGWHTVNIFKDFRLGSLKYIIVMSTHPGTAADGACGLR